MQLLIALLGVLGGTNGKKITPAETSLVVPAGSHVLARLEQRLSIRSTRPGDTIFLRVASAVRVGGNLAIPAGSFVEATVTSVDERVGQIEVGLRVRHLINARGDVSDVFAEDVTPNDSASRRGVAAVAEAGLPRNNGDVLVIGSPIALVVQSAFTVDTRRSLASAFGTAVRVVGTPPRLECFVVSTVATPNVIVPGTPGTPAVGEFPAVPATPDVVVSGTPIGSGHWQHCR